MSIHFIYDDADPAFSSYYWPCCTHCAPICAGMHTIPCRVVGCQQT